MLADARVAIVIPAFNEAAHLEQVLRTLPACARLVLVVDDASTDSTAQVALSSPRDGVMLLRHPTNRGVGAAIRTGYQVAAELGAEVAIVMAGDGQMDPNDLPALIEPILQGRFDYVKGNRFLHPERRAMPLHRRLAGRVLARLTALASGYSIDDSQCGYTALRLSVLNRLALDELWPRYGYPNDLLMLLSAARLRVAEVPVRPIYAGAYSGVRAWHAALIVKRLAVRWRQSRRETGSLVDSRKAAAPRGSLTGSDSRPLRTTARL